MEKDNYYIFVIFGYLAFLTLIVCVLSISTVLRIGILAVAAIFIGIVMRNGRGTIAGSSVE